MTLYLFNRRFSFGIVFFLVAFLEKPLGKSIPKKISTLEFYRNHRARLQQLRMVEILIQLAELANRFPASRVSPFSFRILELDLLLDPSKRLFFPVLLSKVLWEKQLKLLLSQCLSIYHLWGEKYILSRDVFLLQKTVFWQSNNFCV